MDKDENILGSREIIAILLLGSTLLVFKQAYDNIRLIDT